MTDAPALVIDGRWRLESRIGKGGMGEIWRARAVSDGAPVAVKLLHGRLSADPELLARFAREVDLGRRIEHPNAVHVFEGGRLPEGRPYLVMELLQGRPLAGLLRERGPLPWAVVAHVGRQIARGLGAAHAVGVVHRDLKPENVMVAIDDAGTWQVKVFDFGLSAGLVDGPGGLTAADVRLGTPTHMSPEYIVQGTADAATDFYALGVVLYEMLSGTVPFEGRGHQIMRDHVQTPPPPLSERCDAPPWLCAAVHALLEKDPARRPSTVDAVLHCLTPPT